MKRTFRFKSKSYDLETYILKASLHTFLSYKAFFGTELLDDLAQAKKNLDSKEHDDQCDGCLTFMQVLYVLINEGEGIDEPFLDWISNIDSNHINLPEIVSVVSDIYTKTIRPDKKNRSKNSIKDEFASTMTIEEMSDMLLGMGVRISDFHDITFGMAINMLWEHVRSDKRKCGEKVEDLERRYKIMKANLPALTELHDAGKVSDEEYERYRKEIEAWESDE